MLAVNGPFALVCPVNLRYPRLAARSGAEGAGRLGPDHPCWRHRYLEILDALWALAPVVAVRGNIDKEPWASALPTTAVAQAGAIRIYVLHDLQELDLAAAGFRVVISGHSHKPTRTERRGVLYVNPGSAGPRRFRLPVTVARLDLGHLPLVILWALWRWSRRP